MKRWTKAQTLEAAERYWRMKSSPYSSTSQIVAWVLLFEWAAKR